MTLRLPRTRSCFVCGVSNPLGLNLGFEADGATVTARFHPRPEYTGFLDTVHGGLISTVLDEAMVWACGVGAGRFAYCAELTVRFQRPLKPEAEAVVTGTLTANRKDRLFEARAELRLMDGTIIASATGKYLPIPEALLAGTHGDFLEDVGAVLRQARTSGTISPA